MAINLGTAVGYLTLNTSGFTQGVQAAGSSMNSLGANSAAATGVTSAFATSINTATTNLNTFGNTSNSTATRMTALGSVMSSTGGALSKYITLPLIGAGAVAVKFASDFEKALSETKAITGATAEEMKKMKDAALELGASTSFSATEVANGMTNLGSAGFATSEILQAMPGMLDLAASSGTDLAQASEIASSTLRGFGLEASQATHVADVFAKAAAETNAGVTDMGEAMKYIAPVAGSMGVSLEEVAAAIGIMSDSGIKGSTAGTTLRATLVNLAKPTDKMIGVMDDMGFSAYDSAGKLKTLEEIVAGLQKGTANYTEQQRSAAIATITGKEALSGMLALMEAGPEKLAGITKGLQESDGAAREMAATMMDNLAGSIEELMGALETLAITFGDMLIPYVRALANFLQGLVSAFLGLSDGVKQVVFGFGLILAAIGPVLLIGGTLISAFQKMQLVWTAMQGLVTALGAAFGTLLLPILAIVAGLALLWVAWQTNFGGIQELTAEIFAGLKELFTEIMIDVKGIIDGLVELFKAFGEALAWVWETNFAGIASTTTAVFDTIKTIFTASLSLISSVIKLFTAAFRGDWQGMWDAVKEIFNTVGKALYDILNIYLKALEDLIMAFVDPIVKSWNDMWSGISSLWNGLWTGVISFFTTTVAPWLTSVGEAFTAILEPFKEVFNAIRELLKNMALDFTKWVTETIPTFVNSIVDYLKDLPSKMKEKLDKTIEKIAEWGKSLVTKTAEAGKAMIDAVVNFLQTLPDKFKQWFDKVVNYLKSVPSLLGKAGREMMTEMWNGLKAIWTSIEDWFKGILDKIKSFFTGVKSGMNDMSSASSNVSSFNSKGSYASGLDYVPYDGYQATLHEGEQIVTKQDARQRDGGVTINMGGVTIANNMDIDKVSRQLGEKVQDELRGRGM